MGVPYHLAHGDIEVDTYLASVLDSLSDVYDVKASTSVWPSVLQPRPNFVSAYFSILLDTMPSLLIASPIVIKTIAKQGLIYYFIL
jgi:hypothetical protein